MTTGQFVHSDRRGPTDFAEAYIGDPEMDLARTINGILRGGGTSTWRSSSSRATAGYGGSGQGSRIATYLPDYLVIEWGLDAHHDALPFRSWADERLSHLPLVVAAG